MKRLEGMCSHEPGEELDRILANVAALVLQALRGQASCCLPAFRIFGFKIAQLDIHLDRSASAVRVDIQEALFKDIEEGIHCLLYTSDAADE